MRHLLHLVLGMHSISSEQTMLIIEGFPRLSTSVRNTLQFTHLDIHPRMHSSHGLDRNRPYLVILQTRWALNCQQLVTSQLPLVRKFQHLPRIFTCITIARPEYHNLRCPHEFQHRRICSLYQSRTCNSPIQRSGPKRCIDNLFRYTNTQTIPTNVTILFNPPAVLRNSSIDMLFAARILPSMKA